MAIRAKFSQFPSRAGPFCHPVWAEPIGSTGWWHLELLQFPEDELSIEQVAAPEVEFLPKKSGRL